MTILHNSSPLPSGNITISFVISEDGKYFDEEDLRFAKDFASRIALALENARLHEQAQKSLEKAELAAASLEGMIMQAPVAMCILSGSEYTIKIANKKMFEFWGIGAEFLSKPVFEGLPQVKEYFEPLLDQVYYQDKTLSFSEVTAELLRNGVLQTVYINFSYQPVKEQNGKTSGVLAVAIDVTEQVLSRKKVELAEEETQALNEELAATNEEIAVTNEELTAANDQLIAALDKIKESEERFKLAIENTEAGVFDINLKTRKASRSLRHAHIFGYFHNAEEWTLEKMKGHIYPPELSYFHDQISAGLKTGKISIELRIVRLDGQLRWIDIIGKVSYNQAGEPERIVGTVHDITDKKELLKQKDEFISTVSHELKPPLLLLRPTLNFYSGLQVMRETQGIRISLTESLIKSIGWKPLLKIY